MFIIRCDVCQKEVEMEQPNYYPLDPEGWWAAVGATKAGKSRRTPPHACSDVCATDLTERGVIVAQIVRLPFEVREQPKGSANCQTCKKIGTGKRCLFHGPKPEGWPLVTNDNSKRATK